MTKPNSSRSDTGLSKDLVIAEAMRLADRDGFDGLSIRRLAEALRSGAMSLYHYVANKDDLLDAMVDVVFSEIELPASGTDWQAALRRRAVSARDTLIRHPWAITFMESRTFPGPANLRHREAVAACLRSAGFSIAMTTHATWLLDSYTYGFVLQEVTLPAATPDLTGVTEQVLLPQLPSESFPHLHEAATAFLAEGFDPGAEFGFGLDLILTSLERLRESD